MTEYIDNCVMAVGCRGGLGIIHTDDSTCVGCRYNTRSGRDELPDVMCMSCSRRCTDHYEKEEKE